MLVTKIPEQSGYPKANNFDMQYDEFYAIIKEIEEDGLFKKGQWGINREYCFMGLTFKGRSFIEHNDKKEYNKIEKTEVHYDNSIKIQIGGDNRGNIIAGQDNNTNLEFETKFNILVETIKNSELQDKENIVKELMKNKNDKHNLNSYLGKLLTRGAEVASIVSTIGDLLNI